MLTPSLHQIKTKKPYISVRLLGCGRYSPHTCGTYVIDNELVMILLVNLGACSGAY